MEIKTLTTHFPPPTSISGERGSNTCLTHPPVGHNQEKSWLIPNRSISHKTLWIKPTFVGAGGEGRGRSASW